MNERSRWTALVVLCTGMLMIVLDMTIVNVALPSIQASLGFSQANLAWVVNAYLIAFAGLLLLAGRLGDLAGRRNVFLAGLGVFTAASLACGLADSQALLITARFVQGARAALTSAVILGMIVTMFGDPRERARAIGVFAFVASAGAAVGLLAGRVITQLLSWHWIFFINLPIGVVTAIAARRMIEPDQGAGLRAGADVPGAGLVTGAMMLGVYTIVGPAAEQGWLAAETLGLGAATLALLAGFVLRQRTARHPLMPLRVFASRSVTGSNLVQVLGTAGMFGMFFLRSPSLPYVFPVAVLIGTGSGLCFPALMTLAMSGATAEDAGLASGLVNTTGQIGGAVGLAVLATVSAARTSALAARHQPAAVALTGGYHLAFWIACGRVVAAAGVPLVLLRPQPATPEPALATRPTRDMHYASN